MKGKEVRQEDPKTRARPSVFKGCLLTRPRGEEGGSDYHGAYSDSNPSSGAFRLPIVCEGRPARQEAPGLCAPFLSL